MEVKQQEVRYAEKEDLSGILEIMNYEILHGTALYDYKQKTLADLKAWYSDKIRNEFPLLVIEENQTIIAFATYDHFRMQEGFHITVEHSIYSHPDYRNSGAGKLLMRKLIEEARSKHLKNMVACIDGSNGKSMRFHQKFGFVEAGRLERIAFKFDKHLDLVFMQLQL